MCAPRRQSLCSGSISCILKRQRKSEKPQHASYESQLFLPVKSAFRTVLPSWVAYMTFIPGSIRAPAVVTIYKTNQSKILYSLCSNTGILKYCYSEAIEKIRPVLEKQ